MNSVPGCICSGIHTSRKFSSATILASSSHGCLSFTTHVRCTDLSLRLRKSTPGLWYVLAPLLVQRISDFPALSIAYLKRGCSLVPFGPTATLACLLLHESRCFKRRCRWDRWLQTGSRIYLAGYRALYICRFRRIACTYSRVSVYGIDSTNSGMSL